MVDKSYLGIGWSFPPTFEIETGSVKMVQEVEDINQSLHILLSTSLGERVMQPRYGCNLNDYQFESVNAALLSFLTDLIERAILYFEPRIRVERINITSGDSPELLEGLLTISVDYVVVNSNTRFNFVYDFYLNEATVQ